MDAARFAESDGQESDRDRPHAYRYRDFVIRALNDDMPMDQFARWQIAGDEYEPDNPEAIVATGFLTAGTHSVLGKEFLEEELILGSAVWWQSGSSGRNVEGTETASVNDLHATLLHLLGIDHKRLTFFHNGRSYRLTDVAGSVLEKILT